MSLARALNMPLGRRALLRRSTALALGAIATPITSSLALGQPRFIDYPFAHSPWGKWDERPSHDLEFADNIDYG